ncbi:MAG: hypothetical protein A2583_01960 [Bdellovibrionales bacterium RIFOXYD1_FULL_53_11]|nr:MAG: hypothetical protein A2583_01960 [Bdellovibrionales bacterium RIFOXYD1_FULL_53_11]
MPIKSILLVEDEEALVKILSLAFKGAGYRVLSTPKAAQAIVMCSNQKFDCILLDIKLAQGTGEMVIDGIRKPKHVNEKTPILVASGHLDTGLVKDMAGKISGVMVKPFDTEALLQRVASLCGK